MTYRGFLPKPTRPCLWAGLGKNGCGKNKIYKGRRSDSENTNKQNSLCSVGLEVGYMIDLHYKYISLDNNTSDVGWFRAPGLGVDAVTEIRRTSATKPHLLLKMKNGIAVLWVRIHIILNSWIQNQTSEWNNVLFNPIFYNLFIENGHDLYYIKWKISLLLIQERIAFICIPFIVQNLLRFFKSSKACGYFPGRLP